MPSIKYGVKLVGFITIKDCNSSIYISLVRAYALSKDYLGESLMLDILATNGLFLWFKIRSK